MLLFSSGSIEVISEPAKDRVIFLLCPDTRNLRVEWGCTFFLYMIVRVYVFLLPTAHTDCSTGPFINLCKSKILPIMYFPDTMVRTQSAQCTYTVRECLQKIFHVPKYRQRVSLYVSLCRQNKSSCVSFVCSFFFFLKVCCGDYFRTSGTHTTMTVSSPSPHCGGCIWGGLGVGGAGILSEEDIRWWAIKKWGCWWCFQGYDRFLGNAEEIWVFGSGARGRPAVKTICLLGR